MNNIKGSLILLLAAFIWGTAFVAQTSGAGAVGTFTFNAARSIVGALFLAVVIIIKNVLDKRNNSGKVISTENGSRCRAVKPDGKRNWDCVEQKEAVFAGFPHISYDSCPDFAKRFVKVCLERRKT